MNISNYLQFINVSLNFKILYKTSSKSDESFTYINDKEKHIKNNT